MMRRKCGAHFARMRSPSARPTGVDHGSSNADSGAAGVLHHVIDVGVTFGAPLAGEAGVAVASQGIRPLVERLFAGWSAERGRILAETIHDVVLGDGVEEVGRLAAAGSRPELARARLVLAACAAECR